MEGAETGLAAGGGTLRVGARMTADHLRPEMPAAERLTRRAAVLGAASAFLCRPALAARAQGGFAPSGYHLVFADEFDDPNLARINENASGGRPDAPAWRSRYRHDRFTVINKEKQIYVDSAFRGTADHPLGVQPFSIHDSVLTISANPADPRAVRPFLHNAAYTSGCITSELTFWRTYGYYEMRARLPVGKGFWPAFWLLPKRDAWPPEIDVFEGSGARPKDVHVGVLWAPGQTAGTWIEGKVDVADGFHVYGLEWTREFVAWSFDGHEMWRHPNLINEDMYVLANLALGSHDQNWIPDPDASTPFPGRFEIDYVRVYARA
jgi:beta-glucanase (GH16 family)